MQERRGLMLLAKEARHRLRDILGVAGLIELRRDDFMAIPGASRFLHIARTPDGQAANKRYAIVPVVAWALNEPVLDVSRPVLVYCEGTRVLPAIEAVETNALPRLIGQPRDHADLRRLIRSRYGKSRTTGESGGAVTISDFLRI